MDSESHWRTVFERKRSSEVSWYKPRLELSLELIAGTGIGLDGRLIDVGGGDSTLADDLLRLGFSDITVLDIASTALERSRQRLGSGDQRISWKQGDILTVPLSDHYYDLWHDRAVFHFFVEEQARREYVSRASRSVRPDGHLIVATFAEDGPDRCSGLPTMRYSSRALAEEFKPDFVLVDSQPESHWTPQGKEQKFNYCWFRRISTID